MNKKDRQIIFDKYKGHCAYCGCYLEKGWHVDELLPVRRYPVRVKDENGEDIWDRKKHKWKEKYVQQNPENFNIDNQMPACASCNINKHSMSLEEFRSLIKGFIKHLNELNTQYKIAKRYGLVKETGYEIEFYFETKARQDKLEADYKMYYAKHGLN